jgi:hypothetical protein
MIDKIELQTDASATEGLSSTEGAMLKRLVMCGLITSDYSTEFNKIYIQDESGYKLNLIDRVSEAVYNFGKSVSVRYWLSHQNLEADSIKEKTALYMMGLCEAEYETSAYSYSEYTSGVDYDCILNVGNHSLYSELISNVGKYVVLEIEFNT